MDTIVQASAKNLNILYIIGLETWKYYYYAVLHSNMAAWVDRFLFP